MKPTILVLSLLALSVSCQNKRTAAPEPTKKDDTAKTTAQPASAEKNGAKKHAKPEKKSDLPAPSDVAAPPAGAEKSATGLAWTVLKPGTGTEKPVKADKVEVHYTGWSKDGKMFDSSVVRGKPSSFGLGQVIKGWTEGLQLMTVGEKRRFWIPAELAYGEVARRPGAPSGQLTFDVELLSIIAAPKSPADVAAAPATAKVTKSGLKYVVLKEGKGKIPGLKDRVQVHYSGWSKDGTLFDSSVQRGRPASFGVGGVIKGWTEALQLMKEGSKLRLWIPGNLAYGEAKPGAKPGGRPMGQLTFDVELLKVL